MAHRKSDRRIAKARRIAHWHERSASNTPDPSSKLSWSALAELETSLAGRVVLPGDPDYNEARQESNPAFQSYPQVIVYCASERDVLLCLAFARTTGLWVAVRCGGHSTAGYSVNDGMVIDLSELHSVVLDEANATVHVGAGTDFDRFNAAMDGTGWHVPTGACGSVCVGGFVQGGGYGYTSRAFGIQCDKAANFRIALADGRIVNANDRENSDLFWALRGGTGGNFGIVLQVSYRMVRLDQVWAFAVSWDAAHAAEVLELMQQRFMKTGAPDQLGYMMNLGYVGGAPVYMVQGMYCGSRDDGLAAIAAWLEVPSAQLLVDRMGTYPQMDIYLEDHPYSLPDNLPDGAAETKSSGYIDRPLTRAQWQSIVDYFQTSPNGWTLAYLEPYGGAINRMPVGDTAFIHRHVDADLVVDVFWTNDQERQQMDAWLEGFMQLLRPMMNGHVYQNYPDARLADFRHAYFGLAFDRLLEVKKRYDPDNFFHYQQSIRPW